MDLTPTRPAPAADLAALLRPGGNLPPEMTSRIEAALAQVLQGSMPQRSTHRTKLLYRLVNQLRRAGDHEAALALLKAAPSLSRLGDKGVLLHLQVLESAGRKVALDSALHRAGINLGSPNAAALMGMRRRQRIRSDRAALEAAIGPLDRDIQDILNDLPINEAITPTMRQWAGRIRTLSASPLDSETYARRLAWGRMVELLFGLAFTADISDPAVAKFVEKVESLLRPADVSPIAATAAKGQAVMVARVHAGHNSIVERMMPDVAIPEFFIARNVPDNPNAKRRVTMGTKSLTASDFVRAVKLVKKAPHCIVIFPDGPDGKDRRIGTVLGREISIGLGASTLAWHARAATFFVTTRWVNGHVEIYTAEGPVASPDGERNAFEDAFHAFYLKCIEGILLGPPENFIAWGGGFWSGLMKDISDRSDD